MSKEAKSVSIIGGADGPTSVFLAGKGHKDRNVIRRIKSSYRKWLYRKKREKAKKLVKPGAHSLQETIRYMMKEYGAVEADSTFPLYEERKRQLKYSLIVREQPELIGAERRITPPDNMDFNDREALRQWMQELNDWNNQRMERMDQLSESAFSIHYHLYVIDCGEDGTIEIEVEDTRGIMGINSSGKIKKLQKIVKDIYLYYGVTCKDIENNSDRYQMLIAEMSH